MRWEDEDLLGKVNHLYVYHKWWLGQGQRNPKANQISKYVCDVKDGPEKSRNFPTAVSFFAKRLVAAVKVLRDDQLPSVVVIVPSSSKGKISEGLVAVASLSCKLLSGSGIVISEEYDCLNRHTAVDKNAHGGSRSKNKHLNSIEVVNRKFKPGERILLLDDVATTGNTLMACRDILVAAGAREVIMLALTQTACEE